MGLVSTWLNGIGLNYAVAAFEAAGIVTPAALAELNVTHFEALGIEDAEDRRKLFYLVQRIKMAVEHKDGSVDEVDAVLSKTMPSTSLELDEQESLEGGEQEQITDKKTVKTSKENQNLNKKSKSRKLPPPRTSMSSSSRGGGRPMRKHRNDVEQETQLDNAEEFDEEEESEESPDGSDSEWEGDSGDSADDEASSVADSAAGAGVMRRQSRRLSERKHKSSTTAASSAASKAASSRRSSLSHIPANPKPASSSSSRRKSAVHLRSTGLEADYSSTSDSSYLYDTSKTKTRRLSGMPMPKSRQVTSSSRIHHHHHPKSMRTGKKLSTIPANSIPPMSPLVDLPKTSKLATGREVKEHEGESRERNKSSKVRSRLRSNSLDRFSASDSESCSGQRGEKGGINSDSESSRRRRSYSGANSSRRLSKGTMGGSFDSATKTQQQHSPTRKQVYRRTQSEYASPPSPRATVQGLRTEDDSFKGQIARLREDTNAEYELFGAPPQSEEQLQEDMRIRVVVRKRPMSKSEIASAGDVDVIHPLDYGTHGRILVYQPRTRVDLTKEIETIPFAFDNVFDESSTNVQLYQRAVRNLIPALFEGQWASIFAYGQTGSGKTYTMGFNFTGAKDGTSIADPSNVGLYYMAALDVFEAIRTPGFEEFSVDVSLFEIYGGRLFDLLNDRSSVKCLEDSKGKICFPGLSEHEVPGPEHLIALIEQGSANRSTGTTSRNADSSRSHAVLQLHLKKTNRRGRKAEYSRLTFIDLAGSERGADTSSSSRATRMEGAEINTSLLALKEVIRALATGDTVTHVPFRGSKLTQVLKESFVGTNCRSVMIACISPNIGNCEQTLNTLRYADRVKERNAETGALATATQITNMRTSASKPSQSQSLVGETGCSDPHGAVDASSLNSSHASDDLLDELLASPPARAPDRQRAAVTVGEGDDVQKDPHEAAKHLIASHKAAMSAMLGMVKDEMTIVNRADSDRAGLEDYITQLNAIQDMQLSFIVTLREHLLQYHIASNEHLGGDTQALSDDSFEDLRD